MKKNDHTSTIEHPDELLLPYLEGMLGDSRKAEVEKHLAECKECASELRDLDRLISGLREHPSAFCPDSADIVAFVEREQDPNGIISRHLDSCPSCAAIAQSCRSSAGAEELPENLWNGIRDRLPSERDIRAIELQPDAVGFFDRIRSWFRAPAMAAGAVATAVLVAVFLYPHDVSVPNVGLSTVTWDGMAKPKTLLPRAAILMVFKGEDKPIPQERIDSVFTALKPDMAVAERFDLVSPAELRDAVKSGKIAIDPQALEETLKRLTKALNVSVAAVLTIEKHAPGFTVTVDLLRASTGELLKGKTESGIPADALPDRIRAMVFDLIAS